MEKQRLKKTLNSHANRFQDVNSRTYKHNFKMPQDESSVNFASKAIIKSNKNERTNLHLKNEVSYIGKGQKTEATYSLATTTKTSKRIEFLKKASGASFEILAKKNEKDFNSARKYGDLTARNRDNTTSFNLASETIESFRELK